jgi:hypothetical protein
MRWDGSHQKTDSATSKATSERTPTPLSTVALGENELLPCFYGVVVQQLADCVVTARQKHPNLKIYATKTDFKAAYHRLFLNYKTCCQCCTQLPDKGLALMMLRFTFGGAPCPFKWGVISKPIYNLASTILLNDDWNPNNFKAFN